MVVEEAQIYLLWLQGSEGFVVPWYREAGSAGIYAHKLVIPITKLPFYVQS